MIAEIDEAGTIESQSEYGEDWIFEECPLRQ
jgi:hypothetical protein